MMDYEKFEKECERIRQDNNVLLSEFSAWLRKEGLAGKTIQKHRSNVDFYINDYLLCEEPTEAKDGATGIGFFLGYWFIKKAAWSSVAKIKENASSLKKFYQFLCEKGLIDPCDLMILNQTIKQRMPEWIEEMEQYDDSSLEY
ncbi:MAG TPA: recombinase [Clostridiales bacterium]|nr:recombinase [Clostridiales bacterium]